MAVTYTAFPREEFREIVEDLVGYPTIWEGDKVPFVGPKNGRPGSILKLDVKRIRKLGIDVTRQEWNPNAAGGQGANAVSVGGQRIYHLIFRAESFGFREPGFDPLEDIKIKLRFASTRTRLQALNVACAGSGDVITVEYIADNRPVYAAICEFKFGFAPWQEVTDDPGGVIERINDGSPVGPIPFIRID